MTIERPRRAGTLAGRTLLLSTALAAGCSSSDSNDGAQAAFTGDPVTTYVSQRRINRATQPPFSDLPEIPSVLRGDKDFNRSFDVLSNLQDGTQGGIALDYFGSLYSADIDQNFSDNKTGVLVSWSQRQRTVDGGTAVFSAGFDRRIGGFFTGFAEPRNVAIAHAAGLLIVSDSGASDIKVFGTAATGNVAPLFTAASAATPIAPWDVAYDEGGDRLFASLVDGTIAVFDDFALNRPAVATRIIVPSTDGANQATTSLRGIALDPRFAGDRVVFTDIGAENAGRDGRVGAIDLASTASGLTDATFVNTSAAPMRDPVDVVVTADGRLRVADLQANRVLILGSFALASPLSMAPPTVELRRDVDRPSSIAVEPVNPDRQVGQVGDLEDPAAPLAGLVVTVDPGAGDSTILLLDEGLVDAPERTLDFGAKLQGVTVDSLGDVYVGTSAAGVGSVGVINRFVTQRGTGLDLAFDDSRDRLLQIFPGIFIPEPSLEDPIDVDVDETRDLVIISDPGFPRVWMFGRTAGMVAEAAAFLEEGFVAGTALPGGLDYDAPSDRLYLAVSNGTIYVYDDFATNPGTMPDRVITPADALGTTQISTSIREVLYDATNDVLFATEVGGTSGVSDDGAIYVFEGASTASDLASATRVISGVSTGLDDPAELAWNGSTLWVVDTANEAILRFDDALTLDGDVAPTATRAEPNVKGVELAPAAVAPSSGGSITGN